MKQFPTHIVAVDGIIENDKGEILLVRSRDTGLYTVPGGQVEVGGNLIDALKREVMEETGVQIDVGRMICVSSNTASYPGWGEYETIPTKVMFGFVCRYTAGELRTSNETSEVFWVRKENVLDYIQAPPLVERFNAYLSASPDTLYLEYVTRPAYKLNLKRYI